MSPATILVAQADAQLRSQLRGLGEGACYRVLEAVDGPQALDVCRVEAVDVVLLDADLAGLDGWGVLESLQTDPSRSSIPVIMLSSAASPAQAARALDAGAHDFVATPFAPVELAARLAAAVRVKQTGDRLRARSAELAAERHFLEALLDSLEEGIIACDESGHITLFNTATSQRMGGAVPDVASFFSDFELYHADGRTPLRPADTALARALSGEIVRGDEFVVVPKGGEARVLLANGRTIRGSDGHKLGAVVAMHDITERRAAESALAHRALHDPLCGLPNRILLMDRIRAALARGERGGAHPAVLFIDVDRFKEINDSLGHDGGDEVLLAVAGRLCAAVRPGDTVARLGGDEFVVLAEQVTGMDEASRVADRLRDAVTEPLDVDDRTLRVTISIGVCVGVGGDETAADLIRRADAAMYVAKQRGRDRIEMAS